jgi:hypothetical protein
MTLRGSMRAATLAAILGAGALVYLLALGGGTAHSALPAAEQATIGRIAAFQRAAGPADSPPNDETTVSGLVRRIGEPIAGHEVWGSVTPADEVCVQLAEGASACTQPEQFEGRPLIVGAGSFGPGAPTPTPDAPPPGPDELAGIAPDGVANITVSYANNTSETAPVVDNGFYFDAAGRRVKQFTWTTTDGSVEAGRLLSTNPKGA